MNSDSTQKLRVAIVGGGIGGITAALFLHQAGLNVTVYEQTPALKEVGAGIVVPPNMVRPLAKLGLADKLLDFAVQLEAAWEFRRWQDGRVLFVQPMGEECKRLYGTHCYVAHRADLLSMLQQALPKQLIRLNHRCVALQQLATAGRINLHLRNQANIDNQIGRGHRGRWHPFNYQRGNRIDHRCTIFRTLRLPLSGPSRASACKWPSVRCKHCGLDPAAILFTIRFPATEWSTLSPSFQLANGGQSHGQPMVKYSDLSKEFEGWDNRLHQLINSATDTKRWALYDRTPLDRWTQHRVGLLGDAAHAMLPFFAQGAAQAIEDAAVLAACLRTTNRDSAPEALRRYDEIRRPRASQVQLMSRGREVRNHLPDGPEQRQRDTELANGDPLRQSAWLYGHDIDTEY